MGPTVLEEISNIHQLSCFKWCLKGWIIIKLLANKLAFGSEWYRMITRKCSWEIVWVLQHLKALFLSLQLNKKLIFITFHSIPKTYYWEYYSGDNGRHCITLV